MSIRDEVKQQQDKMKDKDFKEKWDYFWEYHKFHVLTVVVALIFIISGVKNELLSLIRGFSDAIRIENVTTPSSFILPIDW